MVKRSYIQITSMLESQGFGPGEVSRTLTEQTYAQLRTDIIEGRLLPGSKLRVHWCA